MITNRTKKLEASVLRRRGYSLRQLSERLNLSRSTVSLWTKNVKLTQLGIDRARSNQAAHRETSGKTLHTRKLDRIKKATRIAENFIRTIKVNRTLNMVILSIFYQCEGSKADRGVRFANSNPEIVRVFLFVLRSCFLIKEDRLHVRVHIHDYHDDEKIRKYWSEVTKVPVSRFYKSFIKRSDHKFKHLDYKGCVHISYSDSHISRVILAFAKSLYSLYI